FEPGGGMDDATREQLLAGYSSDAAALGSRQIDVGVDMLVEIVPRNPFRAAADMDMLSLIFFALVFGAALTLIPRDRAEPMIRVIDALGHVVVKIIDMAMKLAPYGVFGLIFAVTARFGWELLQQLGMYVAVVLGG